MADKRTRRIAGLVEKLGTAPDPLRRAQLALELHTILETVIESNIRDANEAGVTWRDIGSRLGIPFQTLYRRYGGGRPADRRAP